MRKIKFRAWDNVKDQMYFVGEEEDVAFEIVGGKFVGYDAREEPDSPLFKMEHLEVMQYTGLKDKNGVEIYEGDILKWDEKEWGHPFNELVEWDFDQLDMRKRDWAEFCEVIGNVHKNPNLLDQ